MDHLSDKESIEYWTKNIVEGHGGSVKSQAYMTEAERAAQVEENMRLIKEHNFRHGQPIAYEIDGRTVNEYEDGTIIFRTPPKTQP